MSTELLRSVAGVRQTTSICNGQNVVVILSRFQENDSAQKSYWLIFRMEKVGHPVQEPANGVGLGIRVSSGTPTSLLQFHRKRQTDVPRPPYPV